MESIRDILSDYAEAKEAIKILDSIKATDVEQHEFIITPNDSYYLDNDSNDIFDFINSYVSIEPYNKLSYKRVVLQAFAVKYAEYVEGERKGTKGSLDTINKINNLVYKYNCLVKDNKLLNKKVLSQHDKISKLEEDIAGLNRGLEYLANIVEKLQKSTNSDDDLSRLFKTVFSGVGLFK